MQPGVTAVLHTWTRELVYHPHVHCIVTAGGLSLDSSHWIHRQGFLLPVALLKARFRGRIIHHIDRLAHEGKLGLDDTSRETLLCSLPRAKRWNLHIEQPFGRSTHVLQYLGRYTHRIAISDFRLVKVDSHNVTFRTRGEQTITLPALVFMERYMQHVLPPGLHKIRHFGLYAAANVNRKLLVASQILSSAAPNNDDNQASDEALSAAGSTDEQAPSNPQQETATQLLLRLTGQDVTRCPRCHQGIMHRKPLPCARASPGVRRL